MKAFLLSAGLGTRLRPLTEEIPKCLLPIGEKPLLQIWLEHLERQGVDEVLVNTHWHHRKVETLLAKWHSPSLKVTSFFEPVLLGSAGTVLANRHWVHTDEPFFILYGDNLTDANIGEMWSFHREHGLPFTLGVFRTENPTQCGIVVADDDGYVHSFIEKPDNPESDLAAAGIYLADRRIFEMFPENHPTPFDLGHHVIPGLVGRMKCFFIKEFLMDIGTPRSYVRARSLWMARSREVGL